MSERRQRIKLLLDRIEVLLAKAEAYDRPGTPRWRRFLWAYPRFLILNRVTNLLAEVAALDGKPQPAEKWLGMGRSGWLRMQFFFGVLNAWAAIDSAAKAHWIGAAVSFICVIVTAHWRLPYKPPRLR
jgi:hypothetical protein